MHPVFIKDLRSFHSPNGADGPRLSPCGFMGFVYLGSMMMSQSVGTVESKDEKYAHLWFVSFCKFHNISNNESQQWSFDENHVLAFLRDKRAKNMPTWKRLTIVHGLIWYRNHVRRSRTPRLEHGT